MLVLLGYYRFVQQLISAYDKIVAVTSSRIWFDITHFYARTQQKLTSIFRHLTNILKIINNFNKKVIGIHIFICHTYQVNNQI